MLDNFLANLAQVYRSRAQAKAGVNFVAEISPALPATIVADKMRLRQILLNLLENAFKFTKEGEVKLAVELTHHTDETAHLRFTVADTGIGMSARALESIFRPFEQVGDSQQRAKGTGLGLAITQELVDAMDGEIVVESELGVGSRFSFTAAFPATWVAREEPEAASPNGSLLSPMGMEEESRNAVDAESPDADCPGADCATS